MVVEQSLLCGPVIGRDSEIAAVVRALEAAAAGSGSLVLIAGDPGIGKTRLIREVEAAAGDRGFTTLRGTGYQQDQGLPFGPILDALGPLAFDVGGGDWFAHGPLSCVQERGAGVRSVPGVPSGASFPRPLVPDRNVGAMTPK